MSSLQERLAARMEHAMNAIMENMAKMHREFEERMRVERRVMQAEIEAMIRSNFRAFGEDGTESFQRAMPTPVDIALPANKATTSASALTDIAPAPNKAVTSAPDDVAYAPNTVAAMATKSPVMTTTMQMPSPSSKTSRQGLTSPKYQLAATTARPEQAEYALNYSTERGSSEEKLSTMRKLRPHRVKKKPPAKTSHSQNGRLDYNAVASQSAECDMWERTAAKRKYVQRPAWYNATHMPPSPVVSGQSTPLFTQDMARKLKVLDEPRTEALKREDALDILRRKSMVNLPDADLEKAER